MNAREFVVRLLDAYPPALHPTEVATKDLERLIDSLHFNNSQMQILYDEAIKISEYFPKPFNIYAACEKIPTQTKKEYLKPNLEKERLAYGALTFTEWLAQGGREQIAEDCQGDQSKIWRIMGILESVERSAEERSGVKTLTQVSDYDDSIVERMPGDDKPKKPIVVLDNNQGVSPAEGFEIQYDEPNWDNL